MRWHAIDLRRSVKWIYRYSIARYPHLGEKDNIRRRVNRFARLTKRAEIQGKKKETRTLRRCLQKRPAYRVAIAIKERNGKERNADETTPALIVWYACRLLNDPIERVTSVSMKISSDESRDEEPPKEFLRGKARSASLLVVYNQGIN